MKNKELVAKLLLMNPERDVIFWNGEDNINIDGVDEDEINELDIILTGSELTQ